MVPRLLTDQKEHHMQLCQDIIEHLQTEPDLLHRVITGDETCIFEYNLETKHQSCQWKSDVAEAEKARWSKSKVKVLLIMFFDVRGIVHSEFLPQGQMISQQVYKDILRLLLRSVHEKRWELWQDKSWLLHHDNAPAHNALSIQQFLAKKNIAVLEQPPYSPDLTPHNFFLFPKLKGIIKGTRFEGMEAIKRAVMTELRGVPDESFQQCIEAWHSRMEKCVRREGDYFEGGTM